MEIRWVAVLAVLVVLQCHVKEESNSIIVQYSARGISQVYIDWILLCDVIAYHCHCVM